MFRLMLERQLVASEIAQLNFFFFYFPIQQITKVKTRKQSLELFMDAMFLTQMQWQVVRPRAFETTESTVKVFDRHTSSFRHVRWRIKCHHRV